jgi:hypothetical protein
MSVLIQCWFFRYTIIIISGEVGIESLMVENQAGYHVTNYMVRFVREVARYTGNLLVPQVVDNPCFTLYLTLHCCREGMQSCAMPICHCPQ